jgi:hypothetical protein
MYGYDMKELEIFIKDKIGEELSITSFSNRAYNLAGFLGQGISRTTLSFSKYPNIVFKICVGEDGEVCYDAGETEENRWHCAIEEGVAPYFAETEYLCNIKLYGNTWEEDGCGDVIEDIDYSCSYEVPVYIQSRVDETWYDSSMKWDLEEQPKTILSREKKIYDNLKEWISDVDNDRLFSALFIRKYGVNEYIRLANFIQDYDISDLHSANWGVKEGDLVILDYAM